MDNSICQYKIMRHAPTLECLPHCCARGAFSSKGLKLKLPAFKNWLLMKTIENAVRQPKTWRAKTSSRHRFTALMSRCPTATPCYPYYPLTLFWLRLLISIKAFNRQAQTARQYPFYLRLLFTQPPRKQRIILQQSSLRPSPHPQPTCYTLHCLLQCHMN